MAPALQDPPTDEASGFYVRRGNFASRLEQSVRCLACNEGRWVRTLGGSDLHYSSGSLHFYYFYHFFIGGAYNRDTVTHDSKMLLAT